MSQVVKAYFQRNPKEAVSEIGDRLYNPNYRLLILSALGGEVPGALRAAWMALLLVQVNDFSTGNGKRWSGLWRKRQRRKYRPS
ncbi:MAG: hypothetical protein JWQ02_2074 [Capsulimonas sp.]|nr:hypothetical protein [Capsulimonas sp.]